MQALQDLHYVEGQNIVFEYRTAKGNPERALALAMELAGLNVDSIVADGTGASRAAKESTGTIPIVIMTGSDPIADGLVASTERPNGNVTGFLRLSGESRGNLTLFMLAEVALDGQRLSLLKEIVPGIARVGILRDSESASLNNGRWYELAAGHLKIDIQYLDVRGSNPDFDSALEGAAGGRVDAILTARTPLLKLYRKQISELAIKHGLPLMSEESDDVPAGSLISYGANEADMFRRIAVYLDKIFNGAKPAELPIQIWPCLIIREAPPVRSASCEQPTRFELVVNLKTAKQIGLTIPPQVLARADRVIK
jgi:putative ABC transport system substrate-binding protein